MTFITGSFIPGKAPDPANVLICLIIMAIGYIIAISGTLEIMEAGIGLGWKTNNKYMN